MPEPCVVDHVHTRCGLSPSVLKDARGALFNDKAGEFGKNWGKPPLFPLQETRRDVLEFHLKIFRPPTELKNPFP